MTATEDMRSRVVELEQTVDDPASRPVTDQAIGILMERHRCSAAAAFDLLRTRSQARNAKLRDLARELVHEVGGADSSPPIFVPRVDRSCCAEP
jgi:AmiR/NasT family two-component response regulator